eukprot:3340344-Rhodomonas_salina.1
MQTCSLSKRITTTRLQYGQTCRILSYPYRVFSCQTAFSHVNTTCYHVTTLTGVPSQLKCVEAVRACMLSRLMFMVATHPFMVTSLVGGGSGGVSAAGRGGAGEEEAGEALSGGGRSEGERGEDEGRSEGERGEDEGGEENALSAVR